jgi:hypothetical protein
MSTVQQKPTSLPGRQYLEKVQVGAMHVLPAGAQKLASYLKAVDGATFGTPIALRMLCTMEPSGPSSPLPHTQMTSPALVMNSNSAPPACTKPDCFTHAMHQLTPWKCLCRAAVLLRRIC